jgi:hypothetical protein
MAFYLPFDTINGKGQLAHDANILSSIRHANIVEHDLEALQGAMGVL